VTGLGEQDKEWVRLIAREIAFAVFKEAIPLHCETCIHGQKIVKMKWMMVGIGIGIPIASVGALAGLVQVLPKLAAIL